MPDKPFRCKLITPEARVFDASASYVNVPMWDGARGFMANAGAVVGRVGSGELRVEFVDRYEVGIKLEESGGKSWFVSGGFAQFVNNELTILADSAIEAEKVDAESAKAELDAANQKSNPNSDMMDRITADRNRARVKLAMAGARPRASSSDTRP